MLDGVVAEGRGDHMQTLPVAPKGRLWLGRLAPEVVVQNSRLGERSERLEPCEVGVRLRLSEVDGRTVRCTGRLVVWCEFDGGDEPDAPKWRKSEPIEVTADLGTPRAVGPITSAGRDDFAGALRAVGADGMVCEFHAELEMGKDGLELVVTLVNVSPEEIPHWDTNVYEASLVVDAGETLSVHPRQPARLVPLRPHRPGLWRQRRRRAARPRDLPHHRRRRARPAAADVLGRRRSAIVRTSASRRSPSDPLPALRDLVDACERWGADHWAPEVLAPRADAEGWDDGMRAEADDEAAKFFEELARLRSGLDLLETDERPAPQLHARQPCIRRVTARATHGVAAVPARLPARQRRVHRRRSRDGERRVVDTLWFATGGGKTETYLLFVLTAAFYDRLRGKREGITSWGRFPLRMLSLQQTQRFADVLAAAELVRRDEHIGGRRVLARLLRREAAAPRTRSSGSRISTLRIDPDDPDMPGRYQVLLRCPFCGARRSRDALRPDALGARPRVHGAAIARGADSPCRSASSTTRSTARCPRSCSARSTRRRASRCRRRCAVSTAPRRADARHRATATPTRHGAGRLAAACSPAATATPGPLGQDQPLYAPTVRMQDELHLLRDSLGAVDSHYEALLDALQAHYGSVPEDHRVIGHARRARRTGRRSVPPGRPHVPASRRREPAAPSGRATPTSSPAGSRASLRAG